MKFVKLRKINGLLSRVEGNDAKLDGLVSFLRCVMTNSVAYEFCIRWLEGTAEYSHQRSICFNNACLLKYHKRIYIRFFPEDKLKDCFSATAEQLKKIFIDWAYLSLENKNKEKNIVIIQEVDGEIKFTLVD